MEMINLGISSAILQGTKTLLSGSVFRYLMRVAGSHCHLIFFFFLLSLFLVADMIAIRFPFRVAVSRLFLGLLPALLFFLSVLNTAFAQAPQGIQNAGGAGPRPPIGTLTGRVVDGSTKQPLEFATVTLYRAKDSSIVTGAATDAKGGFAVADIPAGMYRAKIEFIGYKPTWRDKLLFTPANPRTDLGDLTLASAAETLDAVTVTAEKAVFQNSIDKKVFNVDKNLIGQGGSATDILQNVPSVSVDIDGNVELRGSGNVRVLIDGKPSALTGASRADVLRQLPASSIESIELITNPSAKYDPEGMAGIINIVLKKIRAAGLNGTVTAGVGSVLNKYNASTSMNYRKGNINIFASYAYRHDDRTQGGYLQRYAPYTDTAYPAHHLYNYLQSADGRQFGNSHLAKAGIDWNVSPKTTLGVAGTLGTNGGIEDELLTVTGRDSSDALHRIYKNTRLEGRYTLNYDANLNFRHVFAPKRELTADATYSAANSTNLLDSYHRDYDPTTENLDPYYHAHLDRNQQQLNNYVLTAQADYTHAISETAGKFETGYRYTNRSIDNNNVYSVRTDGNDAFTVDKSRSADFVYTEQINAVYGTYTNSWGRFGVQPGLRLEQTSTLGTVTGVQDSTFRQHYYSVFPSLNVTYKPTLQQEFRVSYSRRINRPGMEQLNPIGDFSDALTRRVGNPALLPEYVNSYELGYAHNWEKHSLTAALYYREITNQINRYAYFDPTTGITYNTNANTGSRRNYGAELIGRTELAKWWTLTGNVNAYQSDINTGTANGTTSTANSSGFTWNARLLSNMTLPADFQLQISGNYSAPSILPQGTFYGFSSADFGIRKRLMKGKGSLALNVSDVFNTAHFEGHLHDTGFSQVFYRKRETRIATLSFSYTFGNGKAEARRRRSGDQDSPRGDDGGGL